MATSRDGGTGCIGSAKQGEGEPKFVRAGNIQHPLASTRTQIGIGTLHCGGTGSQLGRMSGASALFVGMPHLQSLQCCARYIDCHRPGRDARGSTVTGAASEDQQTSLLA